MKRRVVMKASKEEPMFMENLFFSELGGAIKQLQNQNRTPNTIDKKSRLIDMLKDAFCEEMNAWYQYTIVAPFIKGNERSEVVELFEKNAKDELEDHAMWLLNRINFLRGNCSGIDSPDKWNKVATHKYIIPDPRLTVQKALEQNIKAEMGAIETYKKLEKFTREFDPVSNNKIKEILADEEEHLQALVEFIDDLKNS